MGARGGGVATGGEVPYEILHGQFRPAHAVLSGFGERFVSGPILAGDSVTGDNSAGTVRTAPAMDKNGSRISIQNRQELSNLNL